MSLNLCCDILACYFQKIENFYRTMCPGETFLPTGQFLVETFQYFSLHWIFILGKIPVELKHFLISQELFMAVNTHRKNMGEFCILMMNMKKNKFICTPTPTDSIIFDVCIWLNIWNMHQNMEHIELKNQNFLNIRHRNWTQFQPNYAISHYSNPNPNKH